MANHDAYSEANIATIISILGKHRRRDSDLARDEISAAIGRHVTRYSLAHALKQAGRGVPTSYCVDAPSAGHVPPAGRVGDLRSGVDGDRERDALSGAPGEYRRGEYDADMPPEDKRQNAGSPAQVQTDYRDVDNNIAAARNGSVVNKTVAKTGQPDPAVKGGLFGKVSSSRGQWEKEATEPRKPKPLAGTGAEDLGKNPLVDPSMHIPTAPKSYRLRGVSTLVGKDGEPIIQWIKTAKEPDEVRAELMLDAIKTLAQPLHDSHDPTPAPAHLDSDLLCVYKVPDPHLGMFGWHEEVGKDYDVKIAEALHLKAIRQLAQISPPAKHALVLALGDFFHSDGNMARTARSGNPLDTDSRFAKVLRVGVAMARSMVDCALAKHEHVTAIVEVGNHDDLSSIMLATALSLIYERDPRVTVDTSPARFHWYRFGRCLIGSTHGSETKPEQLPMIMAHDRPEDWGATEHRQFYVGHYHHESVKEYPGVTVEYCRTLAGPDAWTGGKGFRAARGMRCDIWHREFGMVSFNQVGLGQLEAA